MVIKRSTEGAIQDVTDAKVAVFAQGVDTAATETKVRLSLRHLHLLEVEEGCRCLAYQCPVVKWPLQHVAISKSNEALHMHHAAEGC